MSNNKAQVEQLLRQTKVLHEAIIDLYLQVKIRSNDEIDNFDEGQFNKERDRLLKFDSLTVLDYIKTSIEILMQMKLEEEKMNLDGKKGQVPHVPNQESNASSLEQPTPMSSTTKSIDLPPKEYEQQLQQYESEVRNHIKVEQQLKLHIEVLQDKIDDLEKDKEQMKSSFEKDKLELHDKLSKEMSKAVQAKEREIEKLNKEVSKLQNKICTQAQLLEQYEQQKQSQISVQNQQQQQNIMQSIKKNLLINSTTSNGGATNGGVQRTGSSQSKSPPSSNPTNNSNCNTQYSSGTKKVKNTSQGKSPYLNDCFFKLVGGTQTSTGTVSGGQGSNNSSAKSHKKGAQSLNQESVNDPQQITVIKKPKPTSQSIATNNIAENMKIIAAIQRMRMGNQGGLQMNTAGQQNNSSSMSQQQNHKKNKSFSHYGSSGTAGGRITQQSMGNSQHYLTTTDGSAGPGAGNMSMNNAWINDNSQNISASFQNEQISIIDNQQQTTTDPSAANYKVVMMGSAKQNKSKAQGIASEINPNVNQSKSQNYTTQGPMLNTQNQSFNPQQQNQDQNSIIFAKPQQVDIDAYERKNIKKSKVKRDESSQSGRGGSQSQTHTQNQINLNPGSFVTNAHHRVYSNDMIESNNEGGNMIAANHQDIQKQSAYKNTSSIVPDAVVQQQQQMQSQQQQQPQKIKKISQQQIISSHQRGRPKSQMGQYNNLSSNM